MIDFIKKLEILLKNELPGNKARDKMAPSIRSLHHSGMVEKKASVLILLLPGKEEIMIVLIKRTFDNGPHSGQISLPGGMREEWELNDKDTAIRETTEELGIKAEDIRILGKLTRLLIPVSRIEVVPFVGYMDYFPEFTPDPTEVRYLIFISLKKLIDPQTIKHETVIISNQDVIVPYFEVKSEKIWGATAMILSEFIDLVEKVVQDQDFQY